MKHILYFVAVLLLAAVIVPEARAQVVVEQPETEKLAQTGFKFLTVSVDPRAAAMANAVSADQAVSSVGLFYNPASLARMTKMVSAAASQTQYIAEIDYNALSIAFSPSNGAYGVFGLSFVATDYGQIIGTIRADNEQGYERYEDIGLSNPEPTAMALGLGYARALTDRFAIGGQAKYVSQDLDYGVLRPGEGSGYETGDNSLSTFAVDFGVLYRTGFRSLNIAMAARNFAPEVSYYEENFELPLSFRMGVSMDLMDLAAMNQDMHAFKMNVTAERPRDFAENLRLGGEYTFMSTLSLRAGYAFPHDEEGVSFGGGLHTDFGGIGLAADYAYTEFGVFDAVNRFGLSVSF